MRYLCVSLALLLAASNSAQAATLNESDVSGGFSSDFTSPTALGSGFDTVNGSLDVGGYDIFSLASLTTGAQTVSLTFDLGLPAGTSTYQNAGGYVRFKDTPFQYSPEEGVTSTFNIFFDPFNLTGSTPTQTLSFNLDSSYAGTPLFFAVRLTNSSVGALNFGTSVPGNTPAPVPLPAAGLLLLAGLGGFAALRRRKDVALCA